MGIETCKFSKQFMSNQHFKTVEKDKKYHKCFWKTRHLENFQKIGVPPKCFQTLGKFSENRKST